MVYIYKNVKPNTGSKLRQVGKYLAGHVGILAIAVGVLLLTVYGLSFIKKHGATTGYAPIPQSNVVVTTSNMAPSEKHITPDTSTYVVPASQPRKISIPEINVESLVQKVGRTKDNAIAVPTSIYTVGWYTESVLPGSKGLSIIDGHINGVYNPGIFYNLQKVSVGSKILIEFGDKSTKTFEVVEKRQLPENQTAAYMYSHKSDIDSQLNIVTCGGTYNKSIKSYNDRVVVVTKLLGD